MMSLKSMFQFFKKSTKAENKMSYIKSRFFTKKGRKYEVIATAYGYSKDVLDAIDTIRNDKGQTKKMKRSETLKFIKN